MSVSIQGGDTSTGKLNSMKGRLFKSRKAGGRKLRKLSNMTL
jgi:hypothetical protein